MEPTINQLLVKEAEAKSVLDAATEAYKEAAIAVERERSRLRGVSVSEVGRPRVSRKCVPPTSGVPRDYGAPGDPVSHGD